MGESETRLGNGKSNLMTSLSVTVSPPDGATERPRPSRHRGMAGLMSTGLKVRTIISQRKLCERVELFMSQDYAVCIINDERMRSLCV